MIAPRAYAISDIHAKLSKLKQKEKATNKIKNKTTTIATKYDSC